MTVSLLVLHMHEGPVVTVGNRRSSRGPSPAERWPPGGPLPPTSARGRGRRPTTRRRSGSRRVATASGTARSGGRGIRTHEEELPLSGFQDRRHRPLGEPSWRLPRLAAADGATPRGTP